MTNLYGCTIGSGTTIGAFTEIGTGVEVGQNCKIQAHVFIPQGVIIGNNVFIGPHVCFTNCRYPNANPGFKLEYTIVESCVNIGANATILPGIFLGKGCTIAAGAVVTRSVERGETYIK
jgi:acetyltransferase-like isoleucine patch superfamily enzyme